MDTWFYSHMWKQTCFRNKQKSTLEYVAIIVFLPVDINIINWYKHITYIHHFTFIMPE